MKSLDQFINQHILEGIKGYKTGTIKPKEQLKSGKERFANRAVKVDGIENLDTSNVTTMYKMFYNTRFDLDSLDLSSWDVSSVISMHQMFSYCNIKYLDLSNWNTYNMSDMFCMFFNCNKLEYLDVSNWNMSNVEDANSMFSNCNSLKSLDLSTWDFKIKCNKFSIDRMFSGCKSLKSLNVSKFDLSNFNDQDIYGKNDLDLFGECYNLTDIRFGPGWGKSNVSDINLFLWDCGKDKGYMLSDETYESMLTMYDRKKAGLDIMKISFRKPHNIPKGWLEKMEERGYKIKIY